MTPLTTLSFVSATSGSFPLAKAVARECSDAFLMPLPLHTLEHRCALSDILATSPYNLANSRIMMAIEYARRDFIFLLVLYYLAFI